MAGLFDLLNTVIGKITQNSVTYATAPTPPSGDDSTKIATTAFVADKTAAIPSGNVAVWSMDFTCGYANNPSKVIVYAPTGGTWFCVSGTVAVNGYWRGNLRGPYNVSVNIGKVSGGSQVGSCDSGGNSLDSASINNCNALAIKIA